MDVSNSMAKYIYIYSEKNGLGPRGMILGATLLIFRDRRSDWLISRQNGPTYDFTLINRHQI